MRAKTIMILAALIAGNGSVLQVAVAQQAGIMRTDLQQHDLSVDGREVVQVRVDFETGVSFPKHRHPGEEVVYVIEGSLEYQVEGMPAVTLESGDVLFIPAGAVHSVTNIGPRRASELATYIVEKGKPLLALVKKAPNEVP